MHRSAGFSGIVRVAAVLAALVPLSSAQAEIRALVVGVSQFQSPVIPDLKGPEHDLLAVESLARSEGATDVTVIRNEGVTRTTVETALHALGLRSKPGDWILFYYSGHGALAEAAIKGGRDGDVDQFLPLAKFDPDNQDPERFIVDKDFYTWLARYIPPTVQILMVADACHSGTLHRSVDTRAFTYTPRLALRGQSSEIQLVARPAPRYPAILASEATRGISTSPERADLPNLVYMAAAQDDQLALEAAMPVEGAPSRGLLTYSIEQGMTGRSPDGRFRLADLDTNGTVTISELAIYADSQVRALTGQRQQPKTSYVSGRETAGVFAAAVPPRAPLPLDKRLPSIFAIEPASRPLLTGAQFPWGVATRADAADFVWDRPAGTLLRRSGDAVATSISGTAALRGVIEKWDAIQSLQPLLNESRARLVVGPQRNDARYAPGSTVTVALTHQAAPTAARPFATVFNLAADGTVQLLYPLDATDGEGRLGATDGLLPLFESQVVAPFGVDHVVAVVTRDNPRDLRSMLQTVKDQRAAGRLVDAIGKAVASGAGSLSIAEIYTGK